MHYMHDISAQIKRNKISLNWLFRSVVYNVSLALQNVAYYNTGGKKIWQTFYVKLIVFRQNESKIVKSKVSLPVCLQQLVQVVKSIHLQADFTGPVYSQAQYT